MFRIYESLETVSLHEYIYLMLSLQEHALVWTSQSIDNLFSGGVVQVNLYRRNDEIHTQYIKGGAYPFRSSL